MSIKNEVMEALMKETEVAELKEACFNLRQAIETAKKDVDFYRQKNYVGEIGANLTLAYRHLEDARMRLGKSIQALDGGESCYPR